MSKLTVLAAVLALGLTAACQSLPEGSLQPSLEVDSVKITADPGFQVDCRLRHDSEHDLPLRAATVTVFINGTKAAEFTQNYDNELLPPGQDLSLIFSVPANLLPPAAAYSLTYAKMLKLPASVLVHLTFDEKDLGFNPNATFEGIISRE